MLAVSLVVLPAACVDAPPREAVHEHTRSYVSSPAASSLAVLVVAGDEDPKAMYHARALQTRVAAAIGERLQAAGHRVFDHRTLNVNWDSGRRNSDRQLIDSARHDVDETVDALLVFSTFVQTSDVRQANGAGGSVEVETRLRLAARLFDIPAGHPVGHDERIKDVRLDLPAVCDGHCLMEVLGDHARALGGEIGSSAAALLDAADNTLRLAFHGFSFGEIASIDRELRRFPGFNGLRAIIDQDGLRVVEYRSESAGSELTQNLRLMLRFLGLDGRVELTNEGFNIRKRSHGVER